VHWREVIIRHSVRLLPVCMIQDNQTSGEYSEEDLDSLSKHTKEKRPQLARFIEQLKPAGSELWETGALKDDFDFGAVDAQAREALAADQAEAAFDDCIWASIEWK
jgi:hypothetical protein